MKSKSKKRKNSNYHTKACPNGKNAANSSPGLHFSLDPIRSGVTAYCEECGRRKPGMGVSTDTMPLFNYSEDGGVNIRTLCGECMNAEINKHTNPSSDIPLTEQIRAMYASTKQPMTKKEKHFVLISSKDSYIQAVLKKIPKHLLDPGQKSECLSWLQNYYETNGEPHIQHQAVSVEESYEWLMDSISQTE